MIMRRRNGHAKLFIYYYYYYLRLDRKMSEHDCENVYIRWLYREASVLDEINNWDEITGVERELTKTKTSKII